MDTISLNGTWSVLLPGETGTFETQVPGCIETETERKDIASPVRFTKRFTLTKTKKYYALCFGAVSYFCEVYLNGIFLGAHEGMWDSFWMDATAAARDGENELCVDVTKPGYHSTDRFPLRQVLSGFLPDVLCTFGGLWDDVALYGTDTHFVEHHSGRGEADGSGEIRVFISVLEPGEYRVSGTLSAPGGAAVKTLDSGVLSLPAGAHTILLDASVEHPALWAPASPELYRYSLKCFFAGQEQGGPLCRAFGYRTITSNGPQVLLNGKPLYPRGVLHWGAYEDAIIPRPSRETIADEIVRCRAHGFNLIKHCLYIPRQEYLDLSDQLGMLSWIELPLWLPDATAELEPRIRREYPRILQRISGHPSTVLMSLGCELNDAVGADILAEMYQLVKAESGTLVRDNSGSGECYGGLAVDFADFSDYHFYAELQNMEPLLEAFTPAWRAYRPWLFGEFCDSDTMRDLSALRANGGETPLWWERDEAQKNPVSLLKPDFFAGKHEERMLQSGIRADYGLIRPLSLAHSLAHRKTTLEQTRCEAAVSGYVVTSIRDVPIATSGIFDDNMQEKFDANAFSAFNADAVLLPAWNLGRIWQNADRVAPAERYNFAAGSVYALHVLLSNYSGKDLCGFRVKWLLYHNSDVLAQGESDSGRSVRHGEVGEINYLSFPLPEAETSIACMLRVTAESGDMEISNEWPVFLLPPPAQTARVACHDPLHLFEGIEKHLPECERINESTLSTLDSGTTLVTSLWTDAVRGFAARGGNVFCVQRGVGALPVRPVAFWREGMLRTYAHAITGDGLPSHAYDDLRWFSLSTDTALDPAGMEDAGFQNCLPILRRYDCREWLCDEYFAEYSFGKGRLVASTLRFEGGMGKQPPRFADNPFAVYLLARTVQYLQKNVPRGDV